MARRKTIQINGVRVHIFRWSSRDYIAEYRFNGRPITGYGTLHDIRSGIHRFTTPTGAAEIEANLAAAS